MARLYDKEGFPDFEKIEALSSNLNVILAARATGKTYGLIKRAYETNKRMMFMRTTQNSLDEALFDENSTFSQINKDLGTKYLAVRNPRSSFYSIYGDYEINEKGRKIPIGNSVHRACSLIAVGSIRGLVDMSFDWIVYDEFIKRKQEIIRNYQHQADSFMDIVFSLERDRELRGMPPLKKWLLGNSDNLAVPLLTYFNLVKPIIRMKELGENYRKIPERSISIFLLDDSPRAAMLKEKTELSKVVSGTDYADMAYNNNFAYDDFENCTPMPIGQYVPLFTIGKIMVMQHKNIDRYYVRPYIADAINGCKRYVNSPRGKVQCKEDFAYLYNYFLDGIIYFADYPTKMVFKDIFSIDF